MAMKSSYTTRWDTIFFRIIEREITERRKPYSTPDIALK
jgi:hypothetical protein